MKKLWFYIELHAEISSWPDVVIQNKTLKTRKILRIPFMISSVIAEEIQKTCLQIIYVYPAWLPRNQTSKTQIN